MKRTTLFLATVVLLTGCASMKNTLIQDYVLNLDSFSLSDTATNLTMNYVVER